MPYACDSKFFQVLACEARKDIGVNRVVAKRGLILLEAQMAQPGPDVHARAPVSVPLSMRGIRLSRGGASDKAIASWSSRAASGRAWGPIQMNRRKTLGTYHA